jgi:hypothetical protein
MNHRSGSLAANEVYARAKIGAHCYGGGSGY